MSQNPRRARNYNIVLVLYYYIEISFSKVKNKYLPDNYYDD